MLEMYVKRNGGIKESERVEAIERKASQDRLSRDTKQRALHQLIEVDLSNRILRYVRGRDGLVHFIGTHTIVRLSERFPERQGE